MLISSHKVCIFGLSMDHHVFLLSRVCERFSSTGGKTESVACGLHSTAVLIMVAVFSGFATGRFVSTQRAGFGLAFAVFIDAAIVRSVLVPASVKLPGEWNRYYPRFLDWMPGIGVEGGVRQEDPSLVGSTD